MSINLFEVLRKHQLWLDGASMGERANLAGADLTGADLTEEELAGADLTDANLAGADLADVNLTGADLTGANLTGANLTGAILDMSCWPLSCWSFGVRVDARLVWQLVAHIARVVPPDGDADVAALMEAIQPWANKFCEYRDDVKSV